jgi:DNA-binding NarL/FixJ family response regulator
MTLGCQLWAFWPCCDAHQINHLRERFPIFSPEPSRRPRESIPGDLNSGLAVKEIAQALRICDRTEQRHLTAV